MTAVLHPRFAARRSAARAGTWWGKAWVRAVEEAAYATEDLAAGRRLSRSGRIGQIEVDSGGFVAAVEDDGGVWTVVGAVPPLGEEERDALVETVAAEAGRVAALLAGELPHSLAEHAEEAGVELLPYGGELGTTCTCDAWADPCPHALGVLHQIAWLLDADPFVLLHLRGLPREELLARLHGRQGGDHQAAPAADPLAADPDLAVALDAVERARRVVELLEQDAGPADHLF
ncbi:SWIM zinc finger family protein [Nocardioides pantholopis]|uniref:SWIM zinc finger family protein n=1 Tax=Nocardioides pantholopis TaxID=2483798 RepID=UPI001F14CE98|nr:SWIM zinc finger family protein [Nocardioides pantholopis]